MSVENNAKILGRIEEKVDTLAEDVRDINEKLYGNGNGRGIILDQEAQNQKIDKLIEIADKNAKNIDNLFKTACPSWLARNWLQILSVIVIGFLIIHSLIPADVSIWTIIMKWLHLG